MFLSLSPRLTEEKAGQPYDKESMAIIHLNNTTVMYLKEVTKFLALVCFLREESFERKGNRELGRRASRGKVRELGRRTLRRKVTELGRRASREKVRES